MKTDFKKYFNFLILIVAVLLGKTEVQAQSQVQSISLTSFSTTVVNSSTPQESDLESSYLIAKTNDNGSPYTQRTYLKFDFSSIPSNAIIHSATLELKGYNHEIDGGENGMFQFPEESWSQEGLNWENQPNLDESYLLVEGISSAEEDYDLDLTTYVRNLFYFPSNYSNYGLCFRLEDESMGGGTNQELQFYSELADNLMLRPRLEIDYEVPIDLNYRLNSHPIECDDAISGSVSIDISQGNAPYQYQWDDGTSNIGTGKSISGLSAGHYYLTVTDNIDRDFTFEISVGYNPKWIDEDVSQYEAYPNVLEKFEGWGWSEAVRSTNVLAPNTDGWIEYTVDELRHKMFGFAKISDFSQGYTKIRYGIYLRADRTLRKVISGNETTIGSYDIGDIIRIKRDGDVIRYYKNEVEVHSQTVSGVSAEEYITSATMYQPNSRIRLLRTSFGCHLGLDVYAENIGKGKTDGEVYALPKYGIPPYTYSWSNSSTKDRIKNVPAGTYTVTVSDNNGATAQRTVTLYADPDEDMNWESTKSFDENGNLLGASKSFTSHHGKSLQSQSISTRNLNVFASQVGYDNFDRPVLQSLSAPTYQGRLNYKADFMKASDGTVYNEDHFDVPNYTGNSSTVSYGEVDKPYPVQNTVKGELGWYYSNNNTEEAYQDRTDYPFSRTVYSEYNPNQTVKSSAPHDEYSMGSGHESKSYLVPASGELTYMYGYAQGWEVAQDFTVVQGQGLLGGMGQLGENLPFNLVYKAFKRVNYSPSDQESVTFFDSDGKRIATALSGLNDQGNNETTLRIKSTIEGEVGSGDRFVDIHLPEGCENSLDLQVSRCSNCTVDLVYDIIDLISGEVIRTNYTGIGTSIPSGVYRIVDKTNYPSFLMPAPSLDINYEVNYYNFQLNYFDKAGRVVATVTPNGYDYSYNPDVVITDKSQFYDFKVSSTTSSDWNFEQNNQKKITKSFPPPSSLEAQFTNITLFMKEGNSSGIVYNSYTEAQYAPTIAEDGTNEVIPQITYLGGSQNYPSGSFISGGGPQDDYTEYCNGTLGYSEAHLRTILNCTGYSRLDAFQLNNGMWCGRCVQSSGCNLPTKQYDEKYRIKANVKAVTTGGTVWLGEVAFIAKKITLNGADSWDIESLDANNINPSLNPSSTFIVGTELSKTATGIEINVVAVDKWRNQGNLGTPGTSGPNTGCKWEDVLDNNNLDFDDLQLFAGVKTHTIGNYPQHEISNRNYYNSVGEVIRSESEDEGKTEYVYTKDGLLRFSQSAQQRADGKFSYTDYDKFGRPLEMGIVDESSAGLKFQNHYGDINVAGSDYVTHPTTLEYIQNLGDNSGNAINASHQEDRTHIRYDKQDAGLYSSSGLPTGYTQNYMRGRISHVWNAHTATWFSYLSDGRLDWMATNIYGFDTKTIHYTYNALGNVATIVYQKDDATDYFEHKYTYDRVGNLKRTYTRNAATASYVEEAEYHYDLQGQLKRVEIANDLQGIDYIYNTLGMLKAINSPNIGAEHYRKYFVDPGRDGKNGFYQDVFGMSFDYFDGDYSRDGTKVISGTALNDFYDGQTAAIRWNTTMNMAATDQQFSYDYDYYKTGWLKSAFFTTVGDFGDNNNPPTTTTGAMGKYSVYGISYDKNGNLQSMTRRGEAGNSNMDDFTYRYDPDRPNRLGMLNDNVTYSGNYDTDLDDQGSWTPGDEETWNYVYDAEGRMTEDKSEGLQYFYNGYGLVEEIKKDHNNGNGYVTYVKFEYNDVGLRSRKISHDNSGSALKYTWYVRDANGAEIARYEETVGGSVAAPTYPLLADARLGEYDRSDDSRIYEFMDHLGNVRATFSRDATNGLTVNSYADYYPFGSPLPGRQLIAGDRYEHGYQGQFTERDEETGLDAFELRMWDSRLARWHSTDPYGQFHSPYLGMGNNPVSGIDPDGGWNWVGAAIGAGVGGGIGYAATGTWEGAAIGAAGGLVAGGLLGDGIANKLRGNPWGCQQCPNLGNKLDGAKSGFIAKQGFISDTYLANLADKATRHGWAKRLLPSVISNLDWNYRGNYKNSHVVQDLGKVTNLSFDLRDGTGSRQDLIAGHNNNVFIGGNNVPAGVRNLSNPKSGDVIRVQGIENTVDEMLYKGYGNISSEFSMRAFENIHKVKGTMTLGSHGTGEVSIRARPTPKNYRIRVRYE